MQATRFNKTMHPYPRSTNYKMARKGTCRAVLVVLTVPLCDILCVDSFSVIESLRITTPQACFEVFRCGRATAPENVFWHLFSFLAIFGCVFLLFSSSRGRNRNLQPKCSLNQSAKVKPDRNEPIWEVHSIFRLRERASNLTWGALG